MKTTIESDWEELLTEMRKALEYGVPEIGAPEIAGLKRTFEKVVRRARENTRAVARWLPDYLGRWKSWPASD